MKSSPLILVANPGSASRKYALFEGNQERARLHFEWKEGAIYYTLNRNSQSTHHTIPTKNLETVVTSLDSILRTHQILQTKEKIELIGLRVVAPGGYFLQDHRESEAFISHLNAAKEHAPLHVKACLNELTSLRHQFSHARIYGISDSAFHITKPDYAWNYGISLELADKLEIKRFGYHGLSVASVVNQLVPMGKTIVCHLGSGASITAVENGKSKDSTMGYSPLEGMIMSTRSGSLDISAANRLKSEINADDKTLEAYLNTESGLQGLGGSADIRELLRYEQDEDHRAHLALETYTYTLQKGIGQMAGALGGADSLIFTGTVGERSAPIRARVVKALKYLDFSLDHKINTTTLNPTTIVDVHSLKGSKPIYIIPSNEENEIAKRVLAIAE